MPGYAGYFIIEEAILTNITCTLHFNVYKHSHVEFVYPSYWPGSMLDKAIGSDLIYINLLTLWPSGIWLKQSEWFNYVSRYIDFDYVLLPNALLLGDNHAG